MKQTLYYLSNFNNYFNRQVKLPQSKLISDYDNYIAIITNPTNFNPNDGVRTTIVVNYNDLDDDIDLDYLLTSENNVNIKSKWFILDRTRNLSGQWTVTLFRDLLSEYYDSILTSPMFIERALLGTNNPLIFNNEGMIYNQIKKNEELLTDETECAWIVGYCAKDSDLNLDLSNIVYPHDYDLNAVSDYEYYYMNNNSYTGIPEDIRYTINIAPGASFPPNTSQYSGVYTTFDEKGNVINNTNGIFSYGSYSIANWPGLYASPSNLMYSNEAQESFKTAFNNNTERLNRMTNYMNSLFNYNLTKERYQQVINENGKIIRVSNGDFYKINVVTEKLGSAAAPRNEMIVNANNSGGLFTEFDAGIDEIINSGINMGKSESLYPSYAYKLQVNTTITLTLTVSRLETNNFKLGKWGAQLTNIPANSRYHTVDTPYDIFAIPFGDIKLYTNGVEMAETKLNKIIALQTAMSLYNNNPGVIYDIQILPFCPTRYLIKSTNPRNTIDPINNDTFAVYTGDSVDYISTWQTCIFFTDSSTFPFNIEKSINLPIAFEDENNNINFKISNEVDFWRLCSPNYASEFEFSIAKNNGSIEYFNVDCSYKPYNPYIHINPNFKGLYGRDFNDPRGLILSGDFSLPKTQDQWALYEINNKNYKEAFNRQIESMDTLHGYSIEQQKIAMTMNAITTGIQTGSNLLTAGAISGHGALGLGAGAAIGVGAGYASYQAGMADLRYSELAYDEQRDYTVDIFNLNLGNVKARPDTLVGVGALNNNNKIFPVLEYYSCTDEEKEILLKKIKYNSFNVQEIGELQNYISADEQFIKGRLIRLILNDNQSSDFHIANAINDELTKGVYI